MFKIPCKSAENAERGGVRGGGRGEGGEEEVINHGSVTHNET